MLQANRSFFFIIFNWKKIVLWFTITLNAMVHAHLLRCINFFFLVFLFFKETFAVVAVELINNREAHNSRPVEYKIGVKEMFTVLFVGSCREMKRQNRRISSETTKFHSHFVKSDDLSMICSNSGNDSAPSSSRSASLKIFCKKEMELADERKRHGGEVLLVSKISYHLLAIDSGRRSNVRWLVSNQTIQAYHRRQNLLN